MQKTSFWNKKACFLILFIINLLDNSAKTINFVALL